MTSPAAVAGTAQVLHVRPGRRRRLNRPRWGTSVVLLLLAVLWLLPLIVIFFGSVKTNQELYTPGAIALPPAVPQWSNFVDAWTTGNLGVYMVNSAIITAIKVPLDVLAVSLGAFALSRLRWRFATPVFLFFLVGLVIPVQSALIPLHTVLVDLGLINSWAALIVIYLGFGMPFGILIMRGFFNTIPRSLDEAAMIDGASAFRIYRSVIMPLAAPAIATLVIFDSLFTWNEFIFAQLFITDDALRPAQAGLLAFTGSYSQQFTLLNAGILISIAPVVLVYLIFQRRFLAGLAGAVKS